MSERQSQSGQERSDSKRGASRRLRIALLAIATILLFALLFAQAAMNIEKWVRPDSANEAVILYALSANIFLAFIVLLMVLVRNIIKLRRERREMKLGAKFKTRLVTYFISLSLLPVIFLFLATGQLINRSFEKWFGAATNQIVLNALEFENVYNNGEQQRLERAAVTLSRLLASAHEGEIPSMLAAEYADQGFFLAQFYDQSGRLGAEQSQGRFESFSQEFRDKWLKARAAAVRGAIFSDRASQGSDKPMNLIAGAPVASGRGVVVIAQEVSPEIAERIKTIKMFEGEHDDRRSRQATCAGD
jgi:nitrogen fixation/metabolism regulation signal transduction histidine kinase